MSSGMKRGLMSCLVAVLFLVPFVAAEMSLQGPSKGSFSLGEEIVISGSITRSTDTFGLLKFELVCNDKETVLVKSMSLKADVKKEFSETIAVNKFLSGECKIRAFLEVDSNNVEEATSSQFTLSDELLANIKLDKTSVQLGDTITLEGTVTKPNGDNIDGSAKIIFTKGSTVYLQEVVQIKKGKLSYEYNTKDNPAGTYKITVTVADAYNNKKEFVVEDFTIRGEITLTAALEKETLLPGEKLVFSGTATTSDNKVKKGTVRVRFNDAQYETTISRGSFEAGITLPKDIKSGTHAVNLVAEDDFGNRKEATFDITIEQVPTTLNIKLNKQALKPEEQLSIQPTLTDQADDLITTTVDLKLVDADGDLVFQEQVASGGETALLLPKDAVPGEWELQASALDVTTKKTLAIGDVAALQFAVAGDMLKVTNTGNVYVNQEINIAFTSENEKRLQGITETIKLDPNEVQVVDLAVGIDPGTYTVRVAGNEFQNIIIIETRSKGIAWSMILIPLLIVLVLLFLLSKMKRGGNKHHHHKTHHKKHKHRSEKHQVNKFKQNMQERFDAVKKPLKFKFQKQKDDVIMELPSQKQEYAMPKEVDQYVSASEEMYSGAGNVAQPVVKEVQTKEERPVKEKKGLFNMFN